MKKEYKLDEIKVIITSSMGYYGSGSFYKGINIAVYEGVREVKNEKLYFGYGEDVDGWTIYDPFTRKDDPVSLGQYIHHRIAGCKRDCSPGKLDVSCIMEGGKLIVIAEYSVKHVQVGYELCGQESSFRKSLEIDLPKEK